MSLKQKPLLDSIETNNNFSKKQTIYPKAPNYYLMCPKHDACPGFRQITAGMKFPFIIYCHYKQCPELLEALLLKD